MHAVRGNNSNLTFHGHLLITSSAGFIHCEEFVECMEYFCDDLFPQLEKAMVGPDTATSANNSTNIRAGTVSEELKTSVERCKQCLPMCGWRPFSPKLSPALPDFLADEKDRDTTRYINITTIATFFSSVTATTLQFTYAQPDAESSSTLRGIVNFFWFLSLVFSVSSGVCSLLGVTWRRSSVYVANLILHSTTELDMALKDTIRHA